MNRNVIKLFVSVVMIMTIVSACGKQKAVDPSLLKPFVGEWQCEETPLEHEDYYTGFLTLRIQEEGTFSMYDAEAGNPGISGEMEILSDTELVLNCNAEDDFDPPPTWENMSEEQTITYKFVSEYELHMVFENDGNVSTLVFHMGGDDVSVDTFVFMEDGSLCGDNRFAVSDDAIIHFGN